MVASQDLIRGYELEGDLCAQRSEAPQAREWFRRAQVEMNAYAAMHIAACDQGDWNALRKKLAAQTKLDTTPEQTR